MSDRFDFQAPKLADGVRAQMADALYNDVYAKSLPRGEYDRQTAGMSDKQIADATYSTFYEGKIERPDFNKKIGLTTARGATGDAVTAGMSLGFQDEIRAGLGAGIRTVGTLLTGKIPAMADISKAYDSELQTQRDNADVFRQNNPYVGRGLEFAGGMLTGAGAGRTVATAAPGLLARTADAAKVGALAGFGDAEGGLVQRVEGAGQGAAIGGAVGAAAPAIAQGVGLVLGKAGKALGLGDSEKVAQQLLLKAFQDDGVPPQQISARVAEWQAAGAKPEALFDLGGENVKRLARTAAGRTGPGTDKAVTFLEGRQGDQMGRVLNDVEGKLGQSAADFHPTLQGLATQRAVAAAPKYEAAFTRIVPTADEVARVEHFITSKNGQSALNRGLRIIEEEQVKTGAPFNPAQWGVVRNDAGEFTLEPGKVPTLRLMDAIKRGYDDILEGFRDPVTQRLRLTEYGRAVEGNRKAYVGELRDMFPRYGNALDAWSGPSTLMDAAGRGRNIFNMKDADIAAAAVEAKAKPGEADAFRLGVAQAIRDKIAAGADGRDAIKMVFGSPKKREVLEAAFPNQKAFLEFEALMKREARMFTNAQFVSPRTGSQTQMRADDAAGFGGMATEALGKLAMGSLPGHSMVGAVAGIGKDLMARGQGVTPGVADALASRLFTSDPQAIGGTVGLLRQTEIANAIAKAQRARLGGLLTSGATGGLLTAR